MRLRRSDLAAPGYGRRRRGRSLTRRRRTVARVMREVAEELGNTPAVAKASYVDPRIVDLYHDGVTVSPPKRFSRTALESAVLRLLRDA
jgi:DNA topoisomerase I